MEIKNDTGQDLYLVTNKDGEVLSTVVPKDYTVKIISPAQVIRNKMYRPATYKSNQWKFVKMFISTKQLAKEFKDYPEAFLAINFLVDYIEPKTNILMKNSKKGIIWRKDDLARDMGVSRQTAYRYIDKMVEVHLLKQVNMVGKGKVWIVNPYYLQNGDSTLEEIFNSFPKPIIAENGDKQ